MGATLSCQRISVKISNLSAIRLFQRELASNQKFELSFFIKYLILKNSHIVEDTPVAGSILTDITKTTISL